MDKLNTLGQYNDTFKKPTNLKRYDSFPIYLLSYLQRLALSRVLPLVINTANLHVKADLMKAEPMQDINKT